MPPGLRTTVAWPCSVATAAHAGRARRTTLRLALVTEGMIHRSLDELMDWLDVHVPAVRDLEIGTGGYSPLGHSPLELSPRDRGAWLAHVKARGYGVAAFNVSGNPLHPNESIARRHDDELRRTIALAAELEVARVVAMSGAPASGPHPSDAPHFAANAWLPDYRGVAAWQWENRVRPYWEGMAELVARTAPAVTICLELHPGAHVFNLESFMRLNAVAPAIAVNLDPSHLFWQHMDPLAMTERLGGLIAWSHAKDVRYHATELSLNGLLDSRWPGDAATIGWDFAAVGHGEHDVGWWASFVAALQARTGATHLSIEHEDRLVAPEAGIVASAALLDAAANAPARASGATSAAVG
jgi:sugar phosphate isomerase/epimerase